MASHVSHGVIEMAMEAALHMAVAKRCERAYVHELRNGLQGVYASVDVLTRMLEGKTANPLDPDKLRQLTRNAIQNHDRGLGAAVHHLIVQDDSASVVDVPALLNELFSFLSNDAAVRGVQFQFASGGAPIHVYARTSKIRLALLALLTRALDVAESGTALEIAIRSEVSRNMYQVVFCCKVNDATAEHDWHFKPESDPLNECWWQTALARVVHRDQGRLHAELPTRTQLRIELEYPVAMDAAND